MLVGYSAHDKVGGTNLEVLTCLNLSLSFPWLTFFEEIRYLL